MLFHRLPVELLDQVELQLRKEKEVVEQQKGVIVLVREAVQVLNCSAGGPLGGGGDQVLSTFFHCIILT